MKTDTTKMLENQNYTYDWGMKVYSRQLQSLVRTVLDEGLQDDNVIESHYAQTTIILLSFLVS